MEYLSVNRLNDFEFHDAEMKLVSYNGNILVANVKHLNIHKATEQNNGEVDMEISAARITFTDFYVKSFEPGRTWKTDENGNSYTDEPLVILEEKDASEKVITEIKNGINILDFGTTEGGLYYMEGIGIEPFFITTLSFNSIIIEWDKYRGKSWYEEERLKKLWNKNNNSF